LSEESEIYLLQIIFSENGLMPKLKEMHSQIIMSPQYRMGILNYFIQRFQSCPRLKIFYA